MRLLFYFFTLALHNLYCHPPSDTSALLFNHYRSFVILDMSIAYPAAEDFDPKAPLSTKDLATLLLDHCSKSIYESEKRERDVTHESIKQVIKGLGGQIVSLKTTIDQDLAVVCSRLELDVQTRCSYLLELLHSVQRKLHDAHSEFSKHMESHHDQKFLVCGFCDLTTDSMGELVQHISSKHVPTSHVPGPVLYHTQSSPIPTFCYQCAAVLPSYDDHAFHVTQSW